MVSEAQASIKRLEDVVSTRLEPLVTHIAGMQGRPHLAQQHSQGLKVCYSLLHHISKPQATSFRVTACTYTLTQK
jgi:hypothetical protein